ncbi:MAG: tripartite motif-containing protein 71 [Solirubrobacteraceae bacterium]|nr:tripartite motif-containing protein 71 [Solirubrobacteraceae bacterium]
MVVAVALFLAGAPAADGAFAPLLTWGAGGPNAGLFNIPDGVAVDSAGHVYVADRLNNRIQKFTAAGRFLDLWGGPAGAADRQFNAPYGVAVDGLGHVYVADTQNNRIQKLSSTGRFLAKWGHNGGDGTPGVGNGEFTDPRGVAVDDAGNVYVADHGNNRVQKLSPTGRFLARWGANGGDGTAGSGNGEFRIPRGIAVDHAGHVYVADKGNHRIQELSATGRFMRRWGAHGGDGTPGAGDGEFNLPYNIALDGAGDLYVTDVLNHRIQKFSPTGRFLAKYGHNGGDGSPGAGPGEFDEPYGIAADCRFNMYISEEGNQRIQKLGVAGLPAPRCPPAATVRVRSAQRALAARGLVASVACDRPCTARVSASIAGVGLGARAVAATSRARIVMPGARERVRVALSAADARVLGRALRAGVQLRARVTVRATGLAGRARTVRLSVRIAR